MLRYILAMILVVNGALCNFFDIDVSSVDVHIQVCPVSTPEFSFLTFNHERTHNGPSIQATNSIFGDDFSSLSISGEVPVYVRSKFPAGRMSPVLDFSTARNMNNWEMFHGRSVSCRQTHTETYTGDFTTVFSGISSTTTVLMQISEINGSYVGNACVTSPDRCFRTSPCLVDTQVIPNELVYSQKESQYIYSNTNSTDFQFEMSKVEDSSFCRGSMVDAFSEVYWDVELHVLMATKKFETKHIGDVKVSPYARPVRVYQGDVSQAASVYFAQGEGSHVNVSGRRELAIDPPLVKTISLGIPVPLVSSVARNGIIQLPANGMESAIETFRITDSGSINTYQYPKLSQGEIPLSWMMTSLRGIPEVILPTNISLLPPQWEILTPNITLHNNTTSRFLIKVINQYLIPVGGCHKLTTNGAVEAGTVKFGNTCEPGYQFSLVATVTPTFLIFEQRFNDYNPRENKNVPPGDVQQLVAFPPEKPVCGCIILKKNGKNFVADLVNSFITIPVATRTLTKNKFDVPVVVDNVLIDRAHIGGTYPVEKICSVNISRVCTTIGDECIDGGICGRIPYNISYYGLTSMFFELSPDAYDFPTPLFGFQGTDNMIEDSVVKWPVVSHTSVDSTNYKRVAVGVSEVLGIHLDRIVNSEGKSIISNEFSTLKINPSCAPQGSTFTEIVASSSSSSDQGIVTSMSVTISPLPTISSITVLGSNVIYDQGVLYSFTGTPISRSYFENQKHVKIRIETSQLFSNLPPHIPVLHNVVMSAKYKNRLGQYTDQSCTFRGYHPEGQQDSLNYMVLQEEEIKSSILAVHSNNVETMTMNNGKTIATKIKDNEANTYLWKTSTHVYMILITDSFECREALEFKDPVVDIDHTYYSATNSEYLKFSTDIINTDVTESTSQIIHISNSTGSMQPQVKIGKVNITDINNQNIDIVYTTEQDLNTVMSNQRYYGVKAGPLEFNIKGKVIDDSINAIEMNSFNTVADTSSFIHGFSLHNSSCTEGISTLQELAEFKYELPESISYANHKFSGGRGENWLQYSDFNRHSSMVSLENKTLCLQPLYINSGDTQTGTSSNFIVSTTEIHTYSSSMEDNVIPFASHAYTVACLTKRSVSNSQTGASAAQVTSLSPNSTCQNYITPCNDDEITIHLSMGNKDAIDFITDKLCVDLNMGVDHYDLTGYGEICSQEASIDELVYNIVPTCTSLNCDDIQTEHHCKTESNISAFEFQYGGANKSYFKVDTTFMRNVENSVLLSTVTLDLGMFSRIASMMRIRQYFHVGIKNSISGERRVMEAQVADVYVDDNLPLVNALGETSTTLADCKRSSVKGTNKIENSEIFCRKHTCDGALEFDFQNEENYSMMNIECVNNLHQHIIDSKKDLSTLSVFTLTTSTISLIAVCLLSAYIIRNSIYFKERTNILN